MSTQPVGQVCDFLDKHDVQYKKFHDDPVVGFSLSGDNASYEILAIADEESLSFRVYPKVKIPEGCYSDIAEAVLAANNNLRIGNFAFLKDGTLLFKASSLHMGQLEEKFIGVLLAISLGIMDDYFNAFMSIVYANEPGAKAIARVEADLAC